MLSQLIDEAARSSSTCLIHLVINNNTISLDNQLRVLSAYLNNIRFRVYLCSSSRLGSNLVLYQVGTNEAANQISSRASNPYAGYPGIISDISEQVAKDLLHCLNRPSCCHEVILCHNSLAGFINYDRLGAGGADINSEIACEGLVYFGRCPAAILLLVFPQLRHFKIALFGLCLGQSNHS